MANKRVYHRLLTPVRPHIWQAEADLELTLSALPATAVGQLTLTLANWRYTFSYPEKTVHST